MNEGLKRAPSNSSTNQLPPIMSIKREEPTLSRSPSYASSITSPTIPTRSPFRIRDSQLSTANKVTAPSHGNTKSLNKIKLILECI